MSVCSRHVFFRFTPALVFISLLKGCCPLLLLLSREWSTAQDVNNCIGVAAELLRSPFLSFLSSAAPDYTSSGIIYSAISNVTGLLW